MKPCSKFTWKFTGIFIAMTIFLTSVLSYYGYKILLSPEKISAIRGPEEGYFWPMSQYQLFFENLETLTALRLTELDQDPQKITLAYSILKSKFHVISQPSELTRFFGHIPEYQASMVLLDAFMRHLDNNFSIFLHDMENRKIILKMLTEFEEIRPTINRLSNEVRLAEVPLREELMHDFYQNRRALYLSGLLLWLFFIVWVGILLSNVKKSRQLIQQQKGSIAAERRATQAIKEAIIAKNSFIAMISHELRTPLQTIITIIDLLTIRFNTENKEEKWMKPIKRLESAALQLETQMKDLTDYARLDAGRLEIRKSAFDLDELVQSLIDNYSAAAKNKGLLLSCREIKNLSCISELIISDPYRIQQIIGNLISNAIKYTKTGYIDVTVRLTITATGNPLLHFTILDTGPGIPPDQLEKIFQPFTQLDQSNTRRYDGAGLGLAIVSKLLQFLGGSVTTTSKSENLGTTGTIFDVTIPVEFSTEQVEKTDMVSIEENPTQSKETILVVDDNDEARTSIVEMVIEAGFACDFSASANEALTKLFEKHYQLILLDIRMPDKDGFEVIEELRKKNGPNQNTAIIAISAHSPKLLQPEQKNLFHQYLMKPIRYETLRSLLINLLHLKNE